MVRAELLFQVILTLIWSYPNSNLELTLNLIILALSRESDNIVLPYKGSEQIKYPEIFSPL